MLTILGSVKFKDKNYDMIMAYITIINDILLEMVINPSNIPTTSFNFSSLLTRGGKSVVNTFKFLIKSTLQQLAIVKSQLCTFKVDGRLFGNECSEKRRRAIRFIVGNIVTAFLSFFAEKGIRFCYKKIRARIRIIHFYSNQARKSVMLKATSK